MDTAEPITIVCESCKTDFVWTTESQELYKGLGWSAPKNCKKCRDEQRERNRDPNPMD